MTQITVKSIIDAVEKINRLDEDAIEKFSEAHLLHQEEFVGYIMSSGIETQNEQLMDLLMYYFFIFSEAVALDGLRTKPSDEAFFDDLHADFEEAMDEYIKKDDLEPIEDFCNQPNMLAFLIEEIHAEDEEGNELDDETATQLFITGVAMIGGFDRLLLK